MSLVDCTECQAKISSNAVSCPQCGNPGTHALISTPNEKKSTTTTPITMEEITNAGALSKVLGLVGLLSVFFIPPVGLLLLAISGGLTFFAKRKINGLQGPCPHCDKLVNMPAHLLAADCPICKKRFINENSRYVQA